MKFGTGSIVMGPVGVYPKDALVVEGYDGNGNLIVHPFLGGGFPYKLEAAKAARLREVVEPERQYRVFRRAQFELAGSAAAFEGWTDGLAGNGWARPYFELGEAMALIAGLNGRYDEPANAFVTKQGGVQEVWKGEEIKVDGGRRLTAYPIGAGSWQWRIRRPS